MHGTLLRAAVFVGALTVAGCRDAPTLSAGPQNDVRSTIEVAPDDATQSPQCCEPIIVVVPGPAEECDPYTQLDFSCDDDDGRDPCMSSAASCADEYQAVAGCNEGGGSMLPPPDTSTGGTPPPGNGDTACNPRLHPDCEKPLTEKDVGTITGALATMLRPTSEFTDSVARQQCGAIEAAFRRALADGLVFRGAFDSNRTNDPNGGHYGYTSAEGKIHFDPALLDAANAGDLRAVRQVAVTGFHETGHRAGFQHGQPTWDSEGRDYYAELPFSRLNPGENSCVLR